MFCVKYSISYIYNATSTKLEKEVNDAQFAGATYTYYAGNYIYKKGNSQGQQDVALTFFNTEEGYIEPVYEQVTTTSTFGTFTRTVLSDFEYTYQYKDHLGNIRLSYQDMNEDGIIDAATEIKEENHYYPFGLKMKGFNSGIIGRDHNYGYNGIEESNELGNNMLEMDLRQYDPAIARWMVIDPVVHFKYSPYQAFDNNPIFWADPSGADSQITDDGNAISFRGEAAGQAFSAISNALSHVNGESDGCPPGEICGDGYENEMDTVVIEHVKTTNQGGETDWAEINNLRFDRQYNGSSESYGWAFREFYGKTPSEQRAMWNFKYGREFTELHNALDAKARNQALLEKLFYFLAHFKAIEDVAEVLPGNAFRSLAMPMARAFGFKGGIATGASTKTTAIAKYWPDNYGALGKWETKYLMPGTKIDRFGDEFGNYFSPIGTPIPMRALPGINNGVPNAYRVVKPFPVQSSIIAPAFGKPGLGTQFFSPVNANILLKRGIIIPLK